MSVGFDIAQVDNGRLAFDDSTDIGRSSAPSRILISLQGAFGDAHGETRNLEERIFALLIPFLHFGRCLAQNMDCLEGGTLPEGADIDVIDCRWNGEFGHAGATGEYGIADVVEILGKGNFGKKCGSKGLFADISNGKWEVDAAELRLAEGIVVDGSHRFRQYDALQFATPENAMANAYATFGNIMGGESLHGSEGKNLSIVAINTSTHKFEVGIAFLDVNGAKS